MEDGTTTTGIKITRKWKKNDKKHREVLVRKKPR